MNERESSILDGSDFAIAYLREVCLRIREYYGTDHDTYRLYDAALAHAREADEAVRTAISQREGLERLARQRCLRIENEVEP